MLRLTVDQALDELVVLATRVLVLQVDARARTIALEGYITVLLQRYGADANMRLLDPNFCSKNCKLYAFLTNSDDLLLASEYI